MWLSTGASQFNLLTPELSAMHMCSNTNHASDRFWGQLFPVINGPGH